tara:strand:- start:282 stop:737 length:456 start_codon:yes stop_codon:yes gene_type:complete
LTDIAVVLDFSINLPSPMEKLMELSEDFENLPKYLPDQLKSVRILEQKDNETRTEEIIVFSTIIKKEIIQETIHKKKEDDELITEIISGPAKGTTINVKFLKKDSGTNISFNIDLKLQLKAKILQPLIKKYYKVILTSVLYRMNNEILENN